MNLAGRIPVCTFIIRGGTNVDSRSEGDSTAPVGSEEEAVAGIHFLQHRAAEGG